MCGVNVIFFLSVRLSSVFGLMEVNKEILASKTYLPKCNKAINVLLEDVRQKDEGCPKSISARHKIYLIFKHHFSNSEAVQVNTKVITMHLVQCRCQFQVSNLNIKDDFPTEPVLINTLSIEGHCFMT